MNSTRFNELLNRYLADMATVDEQEELMTMIYKGKNDESIRQGIEKMLTKDYADEEMDKERARQILKTVVGSTSRPLKRLPLEKPARWRWLSAAAILLVGSLMGWWLHSDEARPLNIVSLANQEPERAVFTGKQFVRLLDGSTVLLNEGSKLTYASTFGDLDRVVILEGEGYFDVRHNPAKPFHVITGKITTTVLGTTFNVTAYPEQQEVKVTVTRGKVQVNNDARLLGIITPDQQISVNTVTYDFVQRSVKAENVSAWRSEYLILDDVSLGEAAKTIARKYNVTITLANDHLKSCRISATFLKGESLEQVLTVVSGVVQATYTIGPDGDVKIEGKGCA